MLDAKRGDEMTPIPEDLLKALKVFQAVDAEPILFELNEEWDESQVTAWTDACNTMKRYLEGADNGP
jgi:hypothetical protein